MSDLARSQKREQMSAKPPSLVLKLKLLLLSIKCHLTSDDLHPAIKDWHSERILEYIKHLDNPETLFCLGEHLRSEGFLREAESIHRRVLKLDGDTGEFGMLALAELGLIHQAREEHQEAASMFDRFLSALRSRWSQID